MLPLEITFADFTLDGFPTISLICFVSILILAVLAARYVTTPLHFCHPYTVFCTPNVALANHELTAT